MSKQWGGRFQRKTDLLAEQFNASIKFDCRLAAEDIDGSIVHVSMLASCGIITPEEKEQISAGLTQIKGEIQRGEMEWKADLEDIHTHVESRLTEIIGPLAGKMHTARSRNDQAALDLHLYLRGRISETIDVLDSVQRIFVSLAENNLEVIMPGYTHLQRAQPVLLSHHLLAYFWMLQRDLERFQGAYIRADIMPLGAGALAGTGFPINREKVAQDLGFGSIYENSMDAVSDRDYVVEYISAAALCMTHLSRLAEELILWNSKEFSFVEMPDNFATGSSIMPQKKNPDIPELIRGKTGRVNGNLTAILTVLKGLPLAYNKDLQEDKEGLFDTVDTLLSCLMLTGRLLQELTFNRQRLQQAVTEDFSGATDIADFLAAKGVPFREAHKAVGRIVSYCLDNNKTLAELNAAEIIKFHPLLSREALAAAVPAQVVSVRSSRGGTAPSAVKKQLQYAKKVLKKNKLNNNLYV